MKNSFAKEDLVFEALCIAFLIAYILTCLLLDNKL